MTVSSPFCNGALLGERVEAMVKLAHHRPEHEYGQALRQQGLDGLLGEMQEGLTTWHQQEGTGFMVLRAASQEARSPIDPKLTQRFGQELTSVPREEIRKIQVKPYDFTNPVLVFQTEKPMQWHSVPLISVRVDLLSDEFPPDGPI